MFSSEQLKSTDLGRGLKLSGPQFPHSINEMTIRITRLQIGLLEVIHEFIHIKCLG